MGRFVCLFCCFLLILAFHETYWFIFDCLDVLSISVSNQIMLLQRWSVSYPHLIYYIHTCFLATLGRFSRSSILLLFVCLWCSKHTRSTCCFVDGQKISERRKGGSGGVLSLTPWFRTHFCLFSILPFSCVPGQVFSVQQFMTRAEYV